VLVKGAPTAQGIFSLSVTECHAAHLPLPMRRTRVGTAQSHIEEKASSSGLGYFDYRPGDRRLPDRVRGMLPRGRTPCRPSVSARSESVVVRFQGFTPELHFPTSARSLRARSLLLEPAIMDTMKLSLRKSKAAAAGHGEPWVDIVMFGVRSSAGLSVPLPI